MQEQEERVYQVFGKQSGCFGKSEQSSYRRVEIFERVVHRTEKLTNKTVIGEEVIDDHLGEEVIEDFHGDQKPLKLQTSSPKSPLSDNKDALLINDPWNFRILEFFEHENWRRVSF